jgi:LmbE family N-acetylglucosaminyl deacetylase
LYYSTLPKTFIKWGVRFLRLTGQNPSGFGRNKDIDLVKIASWDLPVTARIDIRAVAEIKREASACHASQQMPQQSQSLFQRLFFRRQTAESFTQAYPAFPAKGRISTDLLRD